MDRFREPDAPTRAEREAEAEAERREWIWDSATNEEVLRALVDNIDEFADLTPVVEALADCLGETDDQVGFYADLERAIKARKGSGR